ncbi:g1395 [Coccomyxa viridis]|uniref:G1395 protein n=1 Tax=Coccomyxa viridis TaxID=1274662 RepID=A0ABP1FHX5_9CHLO
MGPPIKRLGIPDVQHIVAVASGKGGVGKSTSAVNLAVALARNAKLRVGLMDADVYGPSIPRMMNLSGEPRMDASGKLYPLQNFGVKCMSMGFLMKDDKAAVWRGPMVMSAIDTFINKVNWGALDVMVIDMPPGTGDAQLSISQRLSLSGAVMVSTPQDIALIDARRGATMFRNVRVPILGIIENMSYYQCPNCGHSAHIFGKDGAKRTAEDFNMELLGQVPLEIGIRETSDAGSPIVASQPESKEAQVYASIADRVKQKLDRYATLREDQRKAQTNA